MITKLLFGYENQSAGRVSTLNYNGFVDPLTGQLADDMGKYFRKSDPLHLGSSGIRLLVGLIRKSVYNTVQTSGRPYNVVLQGNSQSGVSRPQGITYGSTEHTQSDLVAS